MKRDDGKDDGKEQEFSKGKKEPKVRRWWSLWQRCLSKYNTETRRRRSRSETITRHWHHHHKKHHLRRHLLSSGTRRVSIHVSSSCPPSLSFFLIALYTWMHFRVLDVLLPVHFTVSRHVILLLGKDRESWVNTHCLHTFWSNSRNFVMP